MQKSRMISPELDDVLSCIAVGVHSIVKGESWGTIMSKTLPALAKAVDGIQLIPTEFLSDPISFFQTIGIRVGEIYKDIMAAQPITPLAKSKALL